MANAMVDVREPIVRRRLEDISRVLSVTARRFRMGMHAPLGQALLPDV